MSERKTELAEKFLVALISSSDPEDTRSTEEWTRDFIRLSFTNNAEKFIE
jgi:hypothetical protein